MISGSPLLQTTSKFRTRLDALAGNTIRPEPPVVPKTLLDKGGTLLPYVIWGAWDEK